MINEYLLVFSLFFPRWSLLVAWLTASIPLNNLPFVGEFFLTLLFPRILMVIYCATILGIDSGWTIAHLILAVLSLGSYVTAGTSSSRS